MRLLRTPSPIPERTPTPTRSYTASPTHMQNSSAPSSREEGLAKEHMDFLHSLLRYNSLHKLHLQPIINSPYSHSKEYSALCARSINKFCDIWESRLPEKEHDQQLSELNTSGDATIFSTLHFTLLQLSFSTQILRARMKMQGHKIDENQILIKKLIGSQISFIHRSLQTTQVISLPIQLLLTSIICMHHVDLIAQKINLFQEECIRRSFSSHLPTESGTTDLLLEQWLYHLELAIKLGSKFSESIASTLGDKQLDSIANFITDNTTITNLRDNLRTRFQDKKRVLNIITRAETKARLIPSPPKNKLTGRYYEFFLHRSEQCHRIERGPKIR